VNEGAYMQFKKNSTIDRMLHNFYKFNHKPDKVKPEDYLTYDELNEFNINASPSYIHVEPEEPEHLETH
jgi:hypothetical protein